MTQCETLLCLDHLKRLFDSGWECEKGQLQDKECFHCGGEFYHQHEGWGHKADCPWLAAKAFLDGLRVPMPPRG